MHIRNVWAVGLNYRDHVQERGSAVPTEPVIFLKAGSTVVQPHTNIPLPAFSQHVDYEVEIALQLGKNLEIEKYTIALDLTARDLQDRLKAKGLPWTLAKSFPFSCPIGSWLPVSDDLENLQFKLRVNGQLRQKGHVQDMVFSIPQLHEYILNRFPVCPGDLILTGTPAGISQAFSGDQIEAEITGKLISQWTIR